ncbi:carbon-nitrogen hydrolase family protein [Nitrososphaera sp.]|uniref:carbon-nitrogen hydrolase family protein n=1 Tax=Nitrososphaera sp. TaxID=1971748 RepID=UPI00307DAD73
MQAGKKKSMASPSRIAAVAVVQMKSSQDKQENLRASIGYISEAAAKKAGIVCFPEFQMAFSPGSQTPQDLSRIAETIRGEFTGALCREAKKHGIEVIATIYEKGGSRKNSSRVFDTALVIGKNGRITSVYRKLHLYDALGFRESKKLLAGDRIVRPAKTSAAGPVGVMICYDVRFPELSRLLTVKGANVLAVPSGWVQGPMKEEHWQVMLKARAIENGSYVVAPDQVGNIFAGRSMVVDPFGAVLLDMGQREGMEVVELDLGRVAKVRESLPLLKNRRTDLYALKG